MKKVFTTMLIALATTAALLSSVRVWCADEAAVKTKETATPSKAKTPARPPALPVTSRADVAMRWRESGRTVLLLTGHVELFRGTSRVEADRALIWIDEARSAKLQQVAMAVYAEGHVLTADRGVRTVSQRVFFRWVGSAFSVDDADGFIATYRKGLLQGFVARGERVRRTGAVPPGVTTIPPRREVPAGVVPPGEVTGQIIPPTRVARIYGQQQAGPDIKFFTEGDYRITVVTRYPDVVFSDPGSKSGKMEILAENMVIWVNEKKLEEGKRLQEAELEIYAEGHVVIYEGQKTILCEQLYYDYKNQRALLTGGPQGRAMVRTWNRERRIPLYYRAKEFRQVGADHYTATDAIVTTCEFVPPDWAITAKRMDLKTVRPTVTDAEGRTRPGKATERAEVWSSRVKVHGMTFAYWPHWTMDLDRERTLLKRLEIGNSSRFGFTVRTGWDAYNLGIYENDWSSLLLLADYYSDRGFGGGFKFDYQREHAWGDLFVYAVDDHGTDTTGYEPEGLRSRVKWRHRQRLNQDWRLDMELSWIDDPGFMDEYFERELKEEKEQETLAHLRYLKENRYFTLEGKWRLNDFQTQLEKMPEARFVWLGQPLLGGLATYLTDTSLANLRQRFSDPLQKLGLLGPDYRSWRFHTGHEIQLPLTFGPIKLAPFVDAAYTYYENVVEDGDDRILLGTGVRASTTYWKIYNFHNRLWDLNRLRHVVTPTVDVFTTWVRTKNPGDILQFDEIDARDDTKIIRFGLRQRLQTRRLKRTVEPATVGRWYTVNWMVLDLELDYYPDPTKHNDGHDLSPMRMDYLWQVTDRISLLSKADVQLDDGVELETFDIGVLINRSPKMTLYLGERYIDDSGSNIFIGQLNYKLSERWTVGFLGQYDIGLGSVNNYRFILRRRMHRWILEAVYEYDAGDSDHAFMLILEPQGVPEARFRFF